MMRAVKTFLLFCLLIATTCAAVAQKQVYDIASYDAPAEWKAEKSESFISYTKTDGENFCQIAIYKHRTSKGSIEADFDSEWKEVVAQSRTVSEPEKTKPQSAEGWTVMAGTGMWKFNGANVASILTVYSNDKVCMSVLCNTTAQPYLKNLQDLLGSLTLDASKVPDKATTTTSGGGSVVGLWVDYINEVSGYANGYPQYTAGYNRREYLFNADGTYVFRLKNWSVLQKDILFAYEVGTYKVSGDKITIAAKQGSAAWWGKAKDGSTKGWGTLTKASEYRSETVTYTFDLHYFEGQNESHLILKNPGSTQRDRGTGGDGKVNQWSYSPRELSKSLIDNPPGFKVPVGKKKT